MRNIWGIPTTFSRMFRAALWSLSTRRPCTGRFRSALDRGGRRTGGSPRGGIHFHSRHSFLPPKPAFLSPTGVQLLHSRPCSLEKTACDGAEMYARLESSSRLLLSDPRPVRLFRSILSPVDRTARLRTPRSIPTEDSHFGSGGFSTSYVRSTSVRLADNPQRLQRASVRQRPGRKDPDRREALGPDGVAPSALLHHFGTTVDGLFLVMGRNRGYPGFSPPLQRRKNALSNRINIPRSALTATDPPLRIVLPLGGQPLHLIVQGEFLQCSVGFRMDLTRSNRRIPPLDSLARTG